MDFASLGIRIDTSQAKAAVSDLDRFVTAGQKAENAANALANASGKTQKEMASLRSAAASASSSIDKYISSLQLTSATNGLSARNTELFKLAVQGASKAQLEAADSAIRMNEAYLKGVDIGDRLKTGFLAVAAAAGAVAVGLAVGFQKLIEQIAGYQDLSEKIGDSADSIATLKTASDTSGVSLDKVGEATIRLTSALSKTDDESKLVAKAVAALGINFQQFKALTPTEQLDAVAQAMSNFADGSEKTAVAVALFGKAGASLIPFLNDLADGGERQITLTNDQIKAADDYTKAQARLRSEFERFLQIQAAQALPILVDIKEAISGISKEESSASIATEVFSTALGAALNVFQTIAILGANLGFVFLGVGREIGAIAAQLNALAHADLKGFSAISDAVKDDGARARKELDAFEARILGIGKAKPQQEFSRQQLQGELPKPKLDVSSLNTDKTKKDHTAEQEAKAQLALDLDSIKNAQDAIRNVYDAGEKVLEARRAANLVSEGAYYNAKRTFLQIDAKVQDQALQDQISRAQQENLTGKDKIDNDRKIADLQQKLTKLRQDSATSLEVLGIKEAAAGLKLKRAYEEAEAAAQDYYDTQEKQRQREISGLGQGSVARDRNAGRAQIEDKYSQQLQQLASDKRKGAFDTNPEVYDQELDRIKRFQSKSLSSYDDYFKARLEKERDFTVGADEAINNYLDAAANVAKQTEDLFTKAFGGIEDALVSFVTTGKLDFKSLASSIIADIVRIQIKAAATSLFGGGASGSTGGAASLANIFGGSDVLGSFLKIGGFLAKGGPAAANGNYIVGEKGPEILSMGSSPGTVIPNSALGGGSAVVQNVTNNIGSNISRQEVAQGIQAGMKSVKGELMEYLRVNKVA